MKNLLFLFISTFILTGCNRMKTVYVNDNGDTIAAVAENENFVYYKYLLTDKEYDDKYLTFLFDNMNLDDCHYIAVKKPTKWSWRSTPKEKYTGYRCFQFLEGEGIKKIYFSSLEEEKAKRKMTSELKDQLFEESCSGVKHYFGTNMKPVTEYCYAHYDGYTAYNSSDITKHGSSYYVRHIFKAKNMYDATVEYDLMFRISGQGKVIQTWNFTQFTQDPTLWPADYN